MCSTYHSFANNYLINQILFLGFLIHKSAEPSSSFQSVLKPRMCVRRVRKADALLWLQLVGCGRGLDEMMTSQAARHLKCGKNIQTIMTSRGGAAFKMWQKYTNFRILINCGENIQNSHDY